MRRPCDGNAPRSSGRLLSGPFVRRESRRVKRSGIGQKGKTFALLRHPLIPELIDRAKAGGETRAMKRDQAIAILRDHEPELKAIGVLSASVFGSVARDEAGPDSDVDVAVRLDNGFSQGGLDYFWQLEQLHKRLSRLLGCKVDVVTEPARKERLKAAIDKDRALVF